MNSILEDLRKLVALHKTCPEGSLDDKLDAVLQNENPPSVQEQLKQWHWFPPTQPERRWNYTQRLLAMLTVIDQEVKDHVFSTSDRQTCEAAVRQCINLGVLPRLAKDVLIRNDAQVNEEDSVKEYRLYKTVYLLLNRRNPQLRQMVMGKYTCEVLSALIQLCCISSAKVNPSLELEGNEVLTKADICVCEDSIQHIIDSANPVQLFYDLLLLQGADQESQRPAWLYKATGFLIGDLLMKPDGLKHIIVSLLQTEEGSMKKSDWRLSEAISRIIAKCPIPKTKAHKYYQSICEQTIQMLLNGHSFPSLSYFRVAVLVAIHILRYVPVMSAQYLKPKMMGALACCVQTTNSSGPGSVLVTGDHLAQCIHTLHKVFVYSISKSNAVLLHMDEVIHPLYRLYCFLNSGIFAVRPEVEELLMEYFKGRDVSHCSLLLQAWAFPTLASPVPCMKPQLYFGATDSGEVQVLVGEGDCELEVERVRVVDILVTAKEDQLAIDFLLFIFKRLTDTIISLMSNDDLRSDFAKLLEILDLTTDHFNHLVFKQVSDILGLAHTTLERALLVLDGSGEELTQVFMNEMIRTVLSLVSAVIFSSQELSESECSALSRLSPLIDTLRKRHPDKHIKDMAQDLRVALATHGKVVGDVLADLKRTSKTGKQKKPLIQEVMTKYQAALKDLMDPEAATRGHALIVLRKLAQEKDPETISNIDKVRDLMVANLMHRDTYIYMSAITGLTSLADHFPNEVIHVIAKEYAMRSDNTVEDRLKIGEVLRKTLGRLGQMSVVFTEDIFNIITCAIRDSDALIRASAFSNLCSFIEVAKYAIVKQITEICEMAIQAVKMDPSSDVRCAAVLTVNCLINSMGNDAFTLMMSEMRMIFRTLELRLRVENSSVVLDHIHSTLHQVKLLLDNRLTPSQRLEKRIYVAEAPPKPF